MSTFHRIPIMLICPFSKHVRKLDALRFCFGLPLHLSWTNHLRITFSHFIMHRLYIPSLLSNFFTLDWRPFIVFCCTRFAFVFRLCIECYGSLKRYREYHLTEYSSDSFLDCTSQNLPTNSTQSHPPSRSNNARSPFLLGVSVTAEGTFTC